MTIKISQLANVTTIYGNTIIPFVSNATGTLTTVKGNVAQLAEYITSGETTYGDIIPTSDNAYNLGNLTHKWKDLHLSGSTLYLGNSTISSATGGITVASAPIVLFDTQITTNNVVPANIQVQGGLANGSGTISATLTYVDGSSGNLNVVNLSYGSDYVILPTSGGAANLQILLETGYMYSTLGWIGFGDVYITETSTSSTTITNVAVTTDSIVTTSGGLSVDGNIAVTGTDLSIDSLSITSDGSSLTTPPLVVVGGLTGDGISELTGDLVLRETGYDGANAAGTVALYVSSDGGAWGKEGALIVEPNNADGNGIVPSNPSQYTLGTVDFPWLNVYADELTSPTIDDITANLGAVSGSLAAIAANVYATSYGNSNVASYLPSYAGNISSNGVTANAVTTTELTASNVTVNGNIAVNRVTASGAITTSANVDVGSVINFNSTSGSLNFGQGGAVLDGVMPASSTGGGNTTVLLAATGGDAAMVAVPNFGNTVLRNFVEVSPFVVNVGIFPNSATLHSWKFANVGNVGVIQFPDATVQSTAFTGNFTMANNAHWTSNVTTISAALNQLAERLYNIENP